MRCDPAPFSLSGTQSREGPIGQLQYCVCFYTAPLPRCGLEFMRKAKIACLLTEFKLLLVACATYDLAPQT